MGVVRSQSLTPNELISLQNNSSNPTLIEVQKQKDNISIDVMDKRFGAIGDGVTDDTNAINEASLFCYNNGYTLTAKGTFKISNTVTFKCNVNMPKATFNYTGNGIAVIVGDTLARTSDMQMILPFIKQLAKSWGNDIGLKLINVYSSRITIPYVGSFGTGVLVTSYGANGNVYNTYTIGHLQDNKVNLFLQNGDVNAWVNENLFLGGRFSHLSTSGNTVSGASHIMLRGATGSTYQPNNNTFLKPSIEGDCSDYTLDIHGVYNTFIQARFEGELTKKVIFRSIDSTNSRHNMLIGGYQLELINVTQETNSQWNNVISPYKSVLSGGQPTGMQVMKNTGSSSYPVIRVLDTTQDPYDTSSTNYTAQYSSGKIEGKRATDSYNRIEINYALAQILSGDGTATPSASLKYSSSGWQIDGGLFLNANAWNNNLLRFASNRMWIDSFGKVRTKSTAPTSDTDGTPLNSGLSGTTAQRPTTGLYVGMPYFDTTLGKPIWCKSTGTIVWVDSTGTTV